MASDSRRSALSNPAPAPSASVPASARWATRGALLVLDGFVAVISIWGAIWVAPTLPLAWLRGGPIELFADWTVPAILLGVLVGGCAVLAFVAVLASPPIGALMSACLGMFTVLFTLVEMLFIGFTPALYPDQWQAWHQVAFLVVGAAGAVVGAWLWRTETGAYRVAWPPFRTTRPAF